MARSMRSKRGRKLRAVKRIRYGEKELARLKNMLAKAAEEETEILPLAPTTSTSESQSLIENDVQMEDSSKEDQFSKPSKPQKYPSWLSQFKVKKLAKQERKRKHKETKRLKKEMKKTRKNKKK